MLQICKELFRCWNQDVRYCHWKSNEHLQPGLNGDTDLDILVDRECIEIARKELLKNDFLYCKSQLGSRYEGVEDWLGFDVETGRLIHVHLHQKMVTGHRGMKEYTLPWTSQVLETRILDKDTNVYISNPNYELLTLYTRIGLKADIKKRLNAYKGSYRLGSDIKCEIEYLKKKVDILVFEQLVKEFYKESAIQFLKIVWKDELSSKDFLSLINLTEKCLKKNNRYSLFVSFFLRCYYQILLTIRGKLKFNGTLIRRKTPTRGLVIAFIGQDGAGKSTITDAIQKWLSWKLDCTRLYLGSGDHYNSWQKSLQKKLPSHKGIVLKLVSAWLTLTKYKQLAKDVKNMVHKGRIYADNGGIALFDRYPQTQHYGINDGPKIREAMKKYSKNALINIFSRIYMIPEEKYIREASNQAPDLVFKLMLSPEESLMRKPNEDYDKVKRKHTIIKEWEFNKSSVHVIDATMKYEDEILLIKRIIWQHIQK